MTTKPSFGRILLALVGSICILAAYDIWRLETLFWYERAAGVGLQLILASLAFWWMAQADS